MKYVVCFEREGNSWGAYVPDLPGCVAVGKSKEKVQTLIAEAIKFHIEGLRLAGEAVPKPTTKLPTHETSDETYEFIETQVPWISHKGGDSLTNELRNMKGIK